MRRIDDDQDLRKNHFDGWGFELLNQVIREHSMLDLINRLSSAIRHRFEATPDQESRGNLVAHNLCLTTLTRFHPHQLLEFPVKLLNLPPDIAHLLYDIRRILR